MTAYLPAPRRDLVLVAAVTALAGVACFRFEVAERLLAWSRPLERWQADELPLVLLTLVAGLAWYAWRRVGDARAELARRRRVEADLVAAVAQNRELALAVLRVQEDERRALARELHDEVGQHLNAAKLDAVALRDAAGVPDAAVLRLVAEIDSLEGVVRRLVGRLRPAGLDELGLAAAVEACVDGWRARMPDVDFRVRIDDRVEGLDEATNITAFRLVQEGLTNVAKHAQARIVDIALTTDAAHGDVVLAVSDDGAGSASGTGGRGMGLGGMRERVEALAGRFEVVRREPGFGFVARWPLRRVEA
ncbi:MAG: histidine kinase [Burkholderiales bacterium]